MESKELTIASVFCSGGIGMSGYVNAGFTPVYAADLEREPLDIFDANFRYSDGSSVVHQCDATQLGGSEIVKAVKLKTGSEVIHLLEQGPVCHDYTKLNTSGIDFGRRPLMIDAIRLVEEAQPLVAVIEEVPEFLLDENRDVSEEYFKRAKNMNYVSAYLVMNSIHYQSNQARERFVHMLIREDLKRAPVFPIPDETNVRRVQDFLDIDYFCSGHFSDKIKTKRHFMCTVTSSSPKWFSRNGIKQAPITEELMKCMDLDPASFKQASTSTAFRQALANGIPAKLTYSIGKSIIDNSLRVQQNEQGIWVPLNNY